MKLISSYYNYVENSGITNTQISKNVNAINYYGLLKNNLQTMQKEVIEQGLDFKKKIIHLKFGYINKIDSSDKNLDWLAQFSLYADRENLTAKEIFCEKPSFLIQVANILMYYDYVAPIVYFYIDWSLANGEPVKLQYLVDVGTKEVDGVIGHYQTYTYVGYIDSSNVYHPETSLSSHMYSIINPPPISYFPVVEITEKTLIVHPNSGAYFSSFYDYVDRRLRGKNSSFTHYYIEVRADGNLFSIYREDNQVYLITAMYKVTSKNGDLTVTKVADLSISPSDLTSNFGKDIRGNIYRISKGYSINNFLTDEQNSFYQDYQNGLIENNTANNKKYEKIDQRIKLHNDINFIFESAGL